MICWQSHFRPWKMKNMENSMKFDGDNMYEFKDTLKNVSYDKKS